MVKNETESNPLELHEPKEQERLSVADARLVHDRVQVAIYDALGSEVNCRDRMYELMSGDQSKDPVFKTVLQEIMSESQYINGDRTIENDAASVESWEKALRLAAAIDYLQSESDRLYDRYLKLLDAPQNELRDEVIETTKKKLHVVLEAQKKDWEQAESMRTESLAIDGSHADDRVSAVSPLELY